AIAYIRLSGMATFDRATPESLQDARRAAEIAEEAGAGMALAWSCTFMAIAEVGLGQMEAGFQHLEESYLAALEGGHRFQAQNAVFNAVWLAVHMGEGLRARAWFDRARSPEWSASGEVW